MLAISSQYLHLKGRNLPFLILSISFGRIIVLF